MVTSVEVTLTADPTSGSAPLSVSFTSTAKAIIHYADEVCVSKTEEGSVETRTPLYKEVPLTPTCPADCTLEAVGTYPFTATAEYGGVTSSATVTVVVRSCAELQAQVDEARRAAEEARVSLNHARAEARRAEANIALANAEIALVACEIAITTGAISATCLTISATRGQIAHIVTEIASITAALSGTLTPQERAFLLQRLAQLVQESETLRDTLNTLIEALQRLRDYLVSLEQRLSDARTEKAYWAALLPNLRYWAEEFWPQRFRRLMEEYHRLRNLLEECLRRTASLIGSVIFVCYKNLSYFGFEVYQS